MDRWENQTFQHQEGKKGAMYMYSPPPPFPGKIPFETLNFNFQRTPGHRMKPQHCHRERTGHFHFASVGKDDTSRSWESSDKKKKNNNNKKRTQCSMWHLNGSGSDSVPQLCAERKKAQALGGAGGLWDRLGEAGEGTGSALCGGENSPPAHPQLGTERVASRHPLSSQGNRRQLQLSPTMGPGLTE
jgi:hypothetical protein